VDCRVVKHTKLSQGAVSSRHGWHLGGLQLLCESVDYNQSGILFLYVLLPIVMLHKSHQGLRRYSLQTFHAWR
jgi:hypothetical protein